MDKKPREAPQDTREAPYTFKDKEISFDQAQPWRINAKNLLDAALHPKYNDLYNTALQDVDEKKLVEIQPEITSLALRNGILELKDKDGKVLLSSDLREGLVQARRELRDAERSKGLTRSYKQRIESTRRTAYGSYFARMAAGRLPEPPESGRRRQRNKDAGTGGADGEEKPPEAAPSAPKINADTVKLSEARKRERQSLADEMFRWDGEDPWDAEYNIDPAIQDADTEEFEEAWPTMDFSADVDALMQEDPDPESGYRVNPFSPKRDKWNPDKWNRDKIRKIAQMWSHERITYRDTEYLLFTSRYDAFKKELNEADGIPQPLFDALEEADALDKDSLAGSYKKCRTILNELGSTPEKYKDIAPNKEALKTLVQVMEDYIAYGRKLVMLVGKLRCNPAAQALIRTRGMMEFETEKDADGEETKKDTPVNRVKEALHQLFIYDHESPEEYTGELAHWFTPERSLTFQDLRGNTLTVEEEWFTNFTSKESAYHLAYQEIQKQKKEGDREATVVTPENAAKHINDLMELAIGYKSQPELKEMMDDLKDEGAELAPGIALEFGQGDKLDRKNLFRVLFLQKLSDLSEEKEETDLDEEKNELRKELVRLGSVLWRGNQAKLEQREQQERERARGTIKLSEEQAEDVAAALKKTGRFPDERLTQIKSELIGGAGVLVKLGDDARVLGGGAALRLPLENGWSIMFTGTGGETGGAAGLGVSKSMSLTEDLTLTIAAGPGYRFGDTEGWNAGAGASLTKKFSSCAVSVWAGAGAGVEGVGFSAGAGVDWHLGQEEYQEALTKAQLENKMNELDKAQDVYAEVKANPDKYPRIAALLYQIENVSLLSEKEKRSAFEASYEIFKQEIQRIAVDESAPFPLMPVGAGLGAAFLGVDIPWLPYLKISVGSRNLILRIASDLPATRKISEEEAIEAIKKSAGSDAVIAEQRLATSGELVWDPESKKLLVKAESIGSLDFNQIFNKFNELQTELSKNAKIFVTQAGSGLLRLTPQEAHGETRVYVDPALGDNAIVTFAGGAIMISVKNNKKIFFRRQDVNFPFEERGVPEQTTIVITDDPDKPTDTIVGLSDLYVEKQKPWQAWKARPHARVEMPGEPGEPTGRKKQDNIKSYPSYMKWWNGHREAGDRVEFESTQEKQNSYNRLKDAVSLQDAAVGHGTVRPEIQTKIDALTKDEDFVREFRTLATHGYDLIREGAPTIVSDGIPYMPGLIQKIVERTATDISAMELAAAFYAVLITSFQNIWKSGNTGTAKVEYLKFLDSFERPMLRSIFRDTAATDWVYDQFKDENLITQTGESVPSGTLFGTFVGMPGMRKDPKTGRFISETGVRPMMNFWETKPEWGVVGKKSLNITASGEEGEVAKFWLRELSVYRAGAHAAELPDKTEKPDEYSAFKKAILENLYSPLALKLAPLVSVVMTPAEMDALSGVYELGRAGAAVEITEENLPALRKFFDWCDKVRAAELEGKKELWLDESKSLKLLLETTVAHGIYKKCGNISGLVTENFALAHTGSKRMYFAGSGEAFMEAQAIYTRHDFLWNIVPGLVPPESKEVAPLGLRDRERPPAQEPREEEPPATPPAEPEEPEAPVIPSPPTKPPPEDTITVVENPPTPLP